MWFLPVFLSLLTIRLHDLHYYYVIYYVIYYLYIVVIYLQRLRPNTEWRDTKKNWQIYPDFVNSILGGI